MKTYRWTKAIIVVGILWIVISIAWFLKYLDPSQLFVYLAIGAGILCFGGLINWILRIRQYLRNLQKRVDDHTTWITGFENEKNNK